MSTELPESLLQFVRACIPTYQAAEVLLFFAANPDRDFSPAEVVVSMRPVVVTGSAIAEYTAHFAARGLLTEQDSRYRYIRRRSSSTTSLSWHMRTTTGQSR